MILKKIHYLFLIPLLFWSHCELVAQDNPERKLYLRLGTQHLHLLDEQASPILYQGQGLQFQLGFERSKNSQIWKYQLGVGNILLEPENPELRFGEGEATTSTLALQISYLKGLSNSGPFKWSLGGKVQQELLLDFEALADFPWIFAQGGLFAQAQVDYDLAEKHQISGGIALPVFSWLIDMPYHQVPRTEGKAPGVGSAISEGFRIPSWASYQRVDLLLNYQFDFSQKWSLEANYQWAWFHDKEPRDLWAYQGRLSLGISHRW